MTVIGNIRTAKESKPEQKAISDEPFFTKDENDNWILSGNEVEIREGNVIAVVRKDGGVQTVLVTAVCGTIPSTGRTEGEFTRLAHWKKIEDDQWVILVPSELLAYCKSQGYPILVPITRKDGEVKWQHVAPAEDIGGGDAENEYGEVICNRVNIPADTGEDAG